MNAFKLSTVVMVSIFSVALTTLLLLPSRLAYAQGSSPFESKFGIPKYNKAIYLGWEGHIDTQLEFSQFFGGDHTLMAWFMPQYPYAYEGPIFAENGTGIFSVGQGDYHSGDGGFQDAGDPVLFVQLGSKKVIYLVPEFKRDVWQHIAVVRKSNTLKLYVNGIYKTPVKVNKKKRNTIAPDSEIDASAITSSLPYGTLRFGRRTHADRWQKDDPKGKRNWQLYGLLDDVAVFTQALDSTDIRAIINKKRLSGWEANLIAGWCFDQPGHNEKPLPPALDSWREDSPRTYGVPVSTDRKSADDSSQFNNPLIIGETQAVLQLPFLANEVWTVIQGYSDGTDLGSHNGTAAFCYDFNHPTAYAPVLNASSGKAVLYLKDGGVNEQETNRVHIKLAVGEYTKYLHLAANSLPEVISGGVWDAATETYIIPEDQAPYIQQGTQIGQVGPTSNHLHFAGAHENTGDGFTIPMAFSNYWVSEDGGQTWSPVLKGHPKAGQLIKRI